MQSALRRHHQVFILLVILLIHGSMLMMFVSVQFQNMHPQEAQIMMEQEPMIHDQNDHITTIKDFVAINKGARNEETLNQEINIDSNKKEEHQSIEASKPNDTAPEQNIDEIISLAEQFLDPKETFANIETQSNTVNSSPEISSKKVPSLAELAKGFTSHIQQANIGVLSDKKGVASIEQIKYLNFFSKLKNCISTACRIHRSSAPKRVIHRPTSFKVSLDKDGKVTQLTITESSHDAEFDQITLEVMKDAALSFPPLPQFLGDSFTFPFTISPYSNPNDQTSRYLDIRHR